MKNRGVGIYEHYKGHKYLFIAEGVNVSEDGEIVVIYKSLHDGTVWCRPLEMYHDWVDSKGNVVRHLGEGVQRRFDLTDEPCPNYNLKRLEDEIIIHSESGMKYKCFISRRGNPKLTLIGSDSKNKIRPILSGD